jgi:hypothetical protein
MTPFCSPKNPEWLSGKHEWFCFSDEETRAQSGFLACLRIHSKQWQSWLPAMHAHKSSPAWSFPSLPTGFYHHPKFTKWTGSVGVNEPCDLTHCRQTPVIPSKSQCRHRISAHFSLTLSPVASEESTRISVQLAEGQGAGRDSGSPRLEVPEGPPALSVSRCVSWAVKLGPWGPTMSVSSQRGALWSPQLRGSRLLVLFETK